jgi:protoporphyrinogen oxidase
LQGGLTFHPVILVKMRGMNGDAPVVIIGAGPAGLTAAYELLRLGVKSILLEREAVAGGLARTVNYKGYLLDIGGHAFFTKVPAVDRIWREVLGDDLIDRPHLSSIYYNKKFFRYPVQALDALKGLGLIESLRCGLSYVSAQLAPQKPETSFDAWVSNRFGERLYQTFFQTYTEKVWGVPCKEIQADWAVQRMRGLSLSAVLRNAILPGRKLDRRDTVNMLAPGFSYPRKGPGMMWKRMQEMIECGGAEIVFSAPVQRIHWQPGRILSVTAGGRRFAGDHFISSMPLREFFQKLEPSARPQLHAAVSSFRYRDFIVVAVIVRGGNIFSDLTVYIQDSHLKLGRIQNFGNWSQELIPQPETSCLGLEYFCTEGDETWSLPNEALIELAERELFSTGLLTPDQILDATIVRVKKAYPIYDEKYERGVEAARQFLTNIPNLQVVGRNGMHRYNHQDHSMLTAILAARNVAGEHHDLWTLDVYTNTVR